MKKFIFVFSAIAAAVSVDIQTVPKSLRGIGFGPVVSVGQYVTIIPETRNVIKLVNDTYFVSCQTLDGSINAQWRDSQNYRIDPSETNRIRATERPGVGVDLYFSRITLEDAGSYTCLGPRGKSTFSLTVIQPLSFETSLSKQTATKHKPFLMKCVAYSPSLEVELTWKVDDVEIPPNGHHRYDASNGLLIKSVTHDDWTRNYTCVAHGISPHGFLQTKEMNIKLRVLREPFLYSGNRGNRPFGLHEIWAVPGEKVNLTCNASSDPPTSFTWTKKVKTALQFELRSHFDNIEEISMFSPEDNVSILQVETPLDDEETMSDTIYSCSGENSMGKSEFDEKFSLKLASKPQAPEIEIFKVTTSEVHFTVTSYGSTDRLLPITGVVFLHKNLNSTNDRAEWVESDVTKYGERYIVKGLTPGFLYRFKAAVMNEAARGDFSKSVTVIVSKSEAESEEVFHDQCNCNCPIVNNSTGLSINGTMINPDVFETFVKRQFETMQMLENAAKEIKRIGDLLYTVQYGVGDA